MTYREFYNAVINFEGVSTELAEFAEKAIAALDKRNENRKSGTSKSAMTAKANKDAVLNAMEQGKGYTAKEIAVACGFENTQQATGILVQLKKSGLVADSEYSPTGKKKDIVKQYTKVDPEEPTEE